MNGIINVLKPPGMSSFQVVRVLRGLLKIKHIGHAGT
ncbi:MAG: tRNA pseudouridine(55) synthase TruB, partial [Limnochordia bacterium]